jgi:hypothetical protein
VSPWSPPSTARLVPHSFTELMNARCLMSWRACVMCRVVACVVACCMSVGCRGCALCAGALRCSMPRSHRRPLALSFGAQVDSRESRQPQRRHV